MVSVPPCSPAWKTAILLFVLSFFPLYALAASAYPSQIASSQLYLPPKLEILLDDRRPALYTRDFGDCMENSLINLTRFDAAFYRDNLTVVFHIAGHSSLHNESLMAYIGFFAYGKARFELSFDPCDANIYSLCPLNSTKPIRDGGLLPVSPADVAGIPSLAFKIPDFEGQAILRLFSNSTRSQASCYASVVTNGVTLSYPVVVGAILGLFLAVSLSMFIALVIYGEDGKAMRSHYNHTSSLFVTFAVVHHVYFTGALSVNWPSVLVAFWSNFQWFAGMIYLESMQRLITEAIQGKLGNIRKFGAIPVGTPSPAIGNGLNITDIYLAKPPGKKTGILEDGSWKRAVEQKSTVLSNPKHQPADWHGNPIGKGFPLPGTYSGFTSTLAAGRISASNAFLTGILWFMILLIGLASLVLVIKLAVELIVRLGLLGDQRSQRFKFFREKWIGRGKFVVETSRGMCNFPWFRLTRIEPQDAENPPRNVITLLHWKSSPPLQNPQESLNREDNDFILRFDWLAGRFKPTKDSFLVGWLILEFLRACFLGASASSPFPQLIGVLVVEFVFMIFALSTQPFVSMRLNILISALGVSKVASVALSIAFHPWFKLNRITATIIGIVIITIQGLLVALLVFFLFTGIISGYISITKRREIPPDQHEHYPIRLKYLAHIERTASGRPPTPPTVEPEGCPKEKGFIVNSVRRYPKIQDEYMTKRDVEPPVMSASTSGLSCSTSILTPEPISENFQQENSSSSSGSSLSYVCVGLTLPSHEEEGEEFSSLDVGQGNAMETASSKLELIPK
ncbi:hypothetical protein FQN57_003138 [Myotisia sp. PD_48]|nr:hypothetical protein FQN57_003138 [Myotisia sp. PD_48]